MGNVAMPSGNGLWHLYAITSDKIRYESIRADTDLCRMVLLCNTLDLCILRGQELASSFNAYNTQDVKLDYERSLSTDDSDSSNDSDDLENL